MAAAAVALLVISIGMLAAASFWALDRGGSATRMATMFADVSAGLGNRYWVRRVQPLRWLFAALFAVLGLGFLAGALILFTAS